VGAALAWFIRWFVSDGSSRLSARRDAALLAEQIRAFRNGLHDEELVSAARALALDVEDRQRDMRWGGVLAQIKPVIERAAARLSLLRDIARAYDDLSHVDASGQFDARKVLDTALLVVRNDPGQDQPVNQARDQVAGLALRSAWRKQARDRLTNLEQAVEAQVKSGIPGLQSVESALADAEQALARDDLKAVDAAIELNRGTLLEQTSAELARRANPDELPPGVSPETWKTVSARLRDTALVAAGKGSFAMRLDTLQQGQREYFTTVLYGLADAAVAKADAGDSRADHFRKLADDLRAAVKADPLAAARTYSNALADISSADPTGISKGPVTTQEIVVPTPVGWLPLLVSTLASSFGGASSEQGDASAALRTEIRSYGWLVNVAVFAIALATGVKTLYSENLSWGGHAAWLIAFLWGAGVQVVGDAFAGIIGLRAKLGAAT
jgi:hypothetical protein